MANDINKLICETSNNNRVNEDMISELLVNADIQEHIFWNKELIVSYRLVNGFTIAGRAPCVDPANFDIAIGRKVALENAKNQLWQLEGYRLQWKLYESGVLRVDDELENDIDKEYPF